jgi:hypothetical protein
MTSNFPDRIDKALLRPGRIDVQIKFDLATRETIAQMYESMFDVPLPAARLDELPHLEHSPAKVSSILLSCWGSPEQALEAIIAEQLV